MQFKKNVCSFSEKYQNKNQLRPASTGWKVWGWGDDRQYRAFSGFTAALSIVSNIAQPPPILCYWAELQPRSCKIHVSSLSVHRSSGYTIHDQCCKTIHRFHNRLSQSQRRPLLKCESGSSRFQPGEGSSRGLVRDLQLHRLIDLLH